MKSAQSIAQLQYQSAVLIAALAMLSGCSSFSSGSSGGAIPSAASATPSGSSSGGTSSTTGSSTTGDPLQGVWAQACNGENGAPEINTATFDGATETLVEQVFEDDACTTPLFTVTQTSTYALDSSYLATPSGSQAFTVTLAGLTMAPGSTDVATALNSASACGFSNWTLGSAENLFPQACPEWLATPATVDYNVIAISANSSGIMQFRLGAEEASGADGTSASARPVALQSTAYVQQ